VADAAQLDHWTARIDSFEMQVGVRDNAEEPLSDSILIRFIMDVNVGMRRAPLPHELKFRLYPNPAAEKLIVEIDESLPGKDLSIALVNLQGQTLLSERSTILINEIPLSGIPPGIYLIEVQTDTKRGVQRLVVY
jgi:hypothetical protein